MINRTKNLLWLSRRLRSNIMTNAESPAKASLRPETYADFKAQASTRPKFDSSRSFKLTQVPCPEWKAGQGAISDEWKQHKKVTIDPQTRDNTENYKTLISGVVPRPIGFVSSVDKDGVTNLAPFSYFNLANNDPPILTLGFSLSKGAPKDTAKNIVETGECAISIISEWFLEAANMTAAMCPPEVDEWELSGLTKSPSQIVKAPHVAESAYSMECKLVAHHEWTSKKTGEVSGSTLLVEVLLWHIREDTLSEDKTVVDINKLKPVSRLGGVTYGRSVDGYELPKPNWDRLEDYQ